MTTYVNSGEKILITGGAGYLGSVLTQKLMEVKKSWRHAEWRNNTGKKPVSSTCYNWDKVTVYDNLMYNQTPLMNYCYRGDFEFVYGDVRDHEKLLPYILEADVIIPLAGIVGFPACEQDKDLATQVNYEQIKFITENKRPETKLIYPNTNSGYGLGEEDSFCTEESLLKPISHYGKTKCLAEDSVIDADGVAYRLATVFGVSPRMRLDLLVNDFTYKAHTDGYIVLFEWDFNRNYIHVQDVALAFIRAIIDYDFMGGQAYNVGRSDANLTKRQLAEKVKEFYPGFSIQFDNIKEDPDKRNYIVSNEKLETLGWRPYYTIEDGITELQKAFRILKHSLVKYTNL